MATKRSAAKSSKKTARAWSAAPRARPGLSLSSASPSYTVNDIEASLAWYRDVLGFGEGERWERDGKLHGVELFAGKVSFMLGQDDWKKGRDRIKGQGTRIYCMTGQDIDRLAARIKASGGKLMQGPTDQPWGVRDIALEDPDGYQITIAAERKR